MTLLISLPVLKDPITLTEENTGKMSFVLMCTHIQGQKDFILSKIEVEKL